MAISGVGSTGGGRAEGDPLDPKGGGRAEGDPLDPKGGGRAEGDPLDPKGGGRGAGGGFGGGGGCGWVVVAFISPVGMDIPMLAANVLRGTSSPAGPTRQDVAIANAVSIAQAAEQAKAVAKLVAAATAATVLPSARAYVPPASKDPGRKPRRRKTKPKT